MSEGTFEVGQAVEWRKIVSNYGHVDVIYGTVRKVGKRITIEVPLKNGGTRIVPVTPQRLRPRQAPRPTN